MAASRSRHASWRLSGLLEGRALGAFPKQRLVHRFKQRLDCHHTGHT